MSDHSQEFSRVPTGSLDSPVCSRRDALRSGTTALLTAFSAGGVMTMQDHTLATQVVAVSDVKERPWIEVRGIYGGFPQAVFDRGQTPADYGINAIWIGSGGLRKDQIKRCHDLGLRVFAEYNSMHHAAFLKDHPDAAPVGRDGKPSPPPQGWQGVSPFHAGYRRNRMEEFRRVLETFEIDGIWLDYHHSHASWERDEPDMPDTDFSEVALKQFSDATGLQLPADTSAAADKLLDEYRDEWTQFRCGVFTDWVREYRSIVNEVRPEALLGTFHCPWSPDDYHGAIRHKLAIDLPAQAEYIDVFSIMPYHARFGHAQDPEWIFRQTRALGDLLQLTGNPEEKQKIWPIVQLADWGAEVPVEQVRQVLEFGTRRPATGVMVFHWSGVSQQWPKMDAIGEAYRGIRG